jgi:hypothetical protein
MADRKQTPDILGAVLGGEPEQASKPVSQHDSKTVKRQASRPARQTKVADQPDSKLVNQQAGKPVKATFYLSAGTVDLLEDGLHQLRKLAGQADRSRLTKSALVEEALRLLLLELEAKGPGSQLASKLVSQ